MQHIVIIFIVCLVLVGLVLVASWYTTKRAHEQVVDTKIGDLSSIVPEAILNTGILFDDPPQIRYYTPAVALTNAGGDTFAKPGERQAVVIYGVGAVGAAAIVEELQPLLKRDRDEFHLPVTIAFFYETPSDRTDDSEPVSVWSFHRNQLSAYRQPLNIDDENLSCL